LLSARGLRPKKRLGQHFLLDGAAAARIAAACVASGTTRVVEIGAGTGALTRALLDAGAGVTAGNLPYNIATPLITGWLESRNPPRRIVAMVQRDVATRLTAKPSTPQYGSLTLFANYFTTATRAFVLGPGAFYPRPKVDSAVIVLERRPEPAVIVRDPTLLLQVVRAGFAYRRKTLANSLSLALGIDRTRTQAALGTLDIDTEIRAEQLDLGAFGALADKLGP